MYPLPPHTIKSPMPLLFWDRSRCGHYLRAAIIQGRPLIFPNLSDRVFYLKSISFCVIYIPGCKMNGFFYVKSISVCNWKQLRLLFKDSHYSNISLSGAANIRGQPQFKGGLYWRIYGRYSLKNKQKYGISEYKHEFSLK